MTTKTCTKCGKTKPVSEFYPYYNYRVGYRPRCKDCVIEQSKKCWSATHVPKRKKVLIREGFNICPRCKRELPLTEFSASSVIPRGFTYYCKDCQHKDYEKRKKAMENGKVCTCCQKLRPLSSFSGLASSPDGHMGRCKKCVKEAQSKPVVKLAKEQDLYPEGFSYKK